MRNPENSHVWRLGVDALSLGSFRGGSLYFHCRSQSRWTCWRRACLENPLIWSLSALLGGQTGAEFKFLLGVLAGLGGGLDSSLARYLEAEFGVLAPTLGSRMSEAI